MRKLQLLGVSLVAVFAFGVLTAASASAVVVTLLAEWLVNGAAVANEQAVITEGTILLEDTQSFGKADIECSGILDGVVSVDGLDRISEVLLLDKVTVVGSTPLVGNSIACSSNNILCSAPLVWPVNLPWETLMELLEDGTEKFFAILIEGKPGWYVECSGTVGKPTDECTAPTNGVVELSLEGGSLLLGKFSEPFTELAEEKLANCLQGGTLHTEAGIVETIPTQLALVAGGTLSASSEAEEA